MGTGVRPDLHKRFEEAFRNQLFVWPESKRDADRFLRACKRGLLVHPDPRVYALREHWDALTPRDRQRRVIITLARLHPHWIFSYASAALMHKLEVGYGQLGTIHLASSTKSHTRNTGSVCRHIIHDDEFTVIEGVNVTSIERTTFDCMRSSRFPRALAIADSALRVTERDAAAFINKFSHYHGSHRNKSRPIEIMPFANGSAENGGESVSRATIIKLGYMVPDLQVDVPNAVDPTQPYRVDFYWDLKTGPVAGELDGHDKYVDPSMTDGKNMLEILTNERLRESRISGSNIKILRFSYADVRNYPVFSHLLDAFGIPGGLPVPAIACT